MARTKDAVLAPEQKELMEKEYLDFVKPSAYGNKAKYSFSISSFCSGAKTTSFVLAIAYAVLFVSIVVTVCTIDRLSGAK